MARPVGRTGTVSGRDLLTGRPGNGLSGRRDEPVRSRLKVIAFLGMVGLLVVIGGSTLIGPVLAGAARGLAESNPEALRLPFVANAVRDQLGADLSRPAGSDATPVRFVVPSGASGEQIAASLVAQRLVRSKLAFHYFVVQRDLVGKLQAGTYSLNPTMTPEQVVAALSVGPQRDRTIAVALREGLRIEQITAYLQTLPLELDVAEFYELATEPSDALREKYPFLAALPEGRSLEGFLGAGVYPVLPTISAEELLDLLLERWQESVGEEIVARAAADPAAFYERLILASIVEREVTVDEERPIVASVYQNRLTKDVLLNADPAVFYAYDTIQLRKSDLAEWPRYAFWTPRGLSLAKIPLSADLQGFQSYQERGLPPWPICTPSVGSIQAALAPAKTRYFYFVSKNDGTHVFAKNYKEHLRNVGQYQQPQPSASPSP